MQWAMRRFAGPTGTGRGLGLIVASLSLLGCATTTSPRVDTVEPRPDVVAVGTSDVAGPIFTNSDGLALYVTDRDERGGGRFGCSDVKYTTAGGEQGYPLPRADHRATCLDRWKPFTARSSALPIGRWSVIARPEGVRQWAYDGRPLYLSTRDQVDGDVNGTMGFSEYGGWRTVAVPVRLPPGTKLVRRIDGLMLASVTEERLIFGITEPTEDPGPELLPLQAPFISPANETVERAGGLKQWTFKDVPLFKVRDDVPNHIIQARVSEGRWKPILFQAARPRPDFLTLHMTVPEVGWVYADSAGHTLYAFYCQERAPDGLHCDEIGDAAAHWSAVCGTAEQCANEWPPVLAGPQDSPVGNWGIADVPHPPFVSATGAYGEGVPTVRAWTFYGRPVFTFSGDRGPGEIHAHGFEGRVSGFGAITVLKDEFPVMP